MTLAVILIAAALVFGFIGANQHTQQQVAAGLNILQAIAGLVFFIFIGLILFALITS